jgi:murein DD-endopeptidase MepM/ murein hydrolase activator NlpD
MTRRSGWELIGVLWIVTACADPPETEEPAPPAPAEEQAVENAEGEEEVALVEEEVLPEDEAPLPVGITVLEPGKATAALAAPSEIGVTRPLDITFSATKHEGKGKRPLLFPTVRLDATYTRNAPGSGALTIGGVALGEGPGFDTAAVSAVATEAIKGTAAVATDELGAVSSLGWPSATTQAGTVELAATARHALAHLTIPVPTDPLGVGGRWAVKRPVELFGVQAIETIRIKLAKQQGAQAVIRAKITYELDPEAAPAPAFDLASVTGLEGKGTLFARIHLPSGTPIEMHLESALTFTATAADGKTAKRSIDLDARIDEDFLAAADPRVKFHGRFAQGGLVHGVVAPGTKVWHDKDRVKLSDTGDFLIGFGRDARPRARLAFQFSGGEIERHILRVEPRTFEPEKIDGLPPEMVDYDRETERALAKSRKQVSKVRGKSTDHIYFKEGWRWPVKGRITSTYGRKRILNGKDKGYHWGLDIAAAVGKKVRAPAPGVVVLAESNVPLSGMLLIIDHGHGLTSSFLHLSQITVQVGDTVKRGQVIAKTGNSGRTTGPHLDWRMNLHRTRIDPQLLLRGRT